MNLSESKFPTRKRISSCSLFENWGRRQRLSKEMATRHRPRNLGSTGLAAFDHEQAFTRHGREGAGHVSQLAKLFGAQSDA